MKFIGLEKMLAGGEVAIKELLSSKRIASSSRHVRIER
jgi:hypothetical protein